MTVHNRRWILHKFLHLGTGLAGLALLGGCIYEKAEPICGEGSSAQLLEEETGSIIYGGTNHEIRWIANCIDYVRIEFSRNRGVDWVIIAEKVVAREGRYLWEVPQISSELALFRLVDVQTTEVLSASIQVFKVIPTLELKIEDHPELANLGGVLVLTRPAFETISIIRTAENTFKILNLNCTHNGCPVETFDQGKTWVCPCHGSEFTKLGCVIQGPARLPLNVYAHDFNSDSNTLLVYLIQNEQKTC
jgi:Rieske Fe-S protein